MTVLYVVLPLALLIVASAVVAFVWASRSGQFDDLDTPARRALLDDEVIEAPKKTDAETGRHDETAP
jgi:cbb3-type cytochrome oxidase maturation protein